MQFSWVLYLLSLSLLSTECNEWVRFLAFKPSILECEMKVVITLNLSVYDINTITHLTLDKIISVEEALTADCVMNMSACERLGWTRMVQRSLGRKVS